MNPDSIAFAARCAVGDRILPADGFVAAAGRRNISKAAELSGTHLTRAGDVRAANTSGIGRHVCGAEIIRCTKPGTPTKIERFLFARNNPFADNARDFSRKKGFHL